MEELVLVNRKPKLANVNRRVCTKQSDSLSVLRWVSFEKVCAKLHCSSFWIRREARNRNVTVRVFAKSDSPKNCFIPVDFYQVLFELKTGQSVGSFELAVKKTGESVEQVSVPKLLGLGEVLGEFRDLVYDKTHCVLSKPERMKLENILKRREK